MNQKRKLGLALKSTNWHFHSADWHGFQIWPKNFQIKLKHARFDFLGIKIQPNLYLNRSSLFSKHKTSINRLLKSEISTPHSPYVKAVLEALL